MTVRWEVKPLGDVIALEYGKPLPEADRDHAGAYPAYGANGVKCRTDKYYHDKPSIIVGRKGSAGEVRLSEERFWPLDVAYFVTFDEAEYELKFLYYLLSHLDLPNLARGVKPGINRNEIYSIERAFPPLAEQKRIVAILDAAFAAIDTATAHARQNLASARELFESHLNAVFSPNGESWSDATLGQLAEFRNGLNYTKNSSGERVRIVGVRDFQDAFWVPVDDLETVQVDDTLAEIDQLQDGDILTVRSNGNRELIGRCLLAKDVPPRTSHSGFTIRIRTSSDEVDRLFLIHLLKSAESRRQLAASGGGVNISSLNQRTLSELRIELPPKDRQTAIVSQIELANRQRNQLTTLYTRKLALLAELKQSILQKAFTGELPTGAAAAEVEAVA